ncbi:FAD binding oxidoreductase [Aspergillus arachidicola]|uniref:FAD binding oxidoreductase n=1 Tax=Aspergillus arachidicola TaxID=656916 RepID=A0A2G7G1L4_9EURO|nr:FAD binding oxidoreductase [Aspergillus arachidicola]
MPFLSYAHILELQQQLEGTRARVICAGSDEYAESIKRWSDTCEKEAGAVVKVTSTFEVSEVIKFARKNRISFAVEAGGHSTTGSSASHGGIVISLSQMRKVLTDPASKTVCVQGGATWQDVNSSTAPYGLVVVGATSSHAGVGGSTLGGGYGWLTGRYGLIIDSLLSVRMVLADGSIVEASETTSPDLFWAVRGAGQAFGVVTELVFRALYFTPDKLPNIVDFANEFHRRMDENSGLMFGFTAPPFMEETAVLVIPFYNGTREEAEDFFGPILSASPVAGQTDMMSYTRLNAVANVEPSPEGRKNINGTNISLPFDSGFVNDVYNQFDRIMRSCRRVGNSVLMFELLPYNHIIEVPLDATACANRGRYYNVGSIFCWQDPDLDQKILAEQQGIISKIESFGSRDEGEKRVAKYANYAGHNISPAKLFGENLERLQQLKRAYDPNNVFRKWHDLHHQKNPV